MASSGVSGSPFDVRANPSWLMSRTIIIAMSQQASSQGDSFTFLTSQPLIHLPRRTHHAHLQAYAFDSGNNKWHRRSEAESHRSPLMPDPLLSQFHMLHGYRSVEPVARTPAVVLPQKVQGRPQLGGQVPHLHRASILDHFYHWSIPFHAAIRQYLYQLSRVGWPDFFSSDFFQGDVMDSTNPLIDSKNSGSRSSSASTSTSERSTSKV